MNRIKIFNAKVITPFRLIDNGCVLIENGKIVSVNEGSAAFEGCREIDAEGSYISPGFIDIHTHGAGGHDFMDGTVEAYLGAAEMHARHGTTALNPTTVASTNDELKNTFAVYRTAKALNKNGAQFLGIHLEGPYFAMSQRGAQDPEHIRAPKPEEYMEIIGMSGDIVRWSSAPELDGALEFGRFIKSRGILPAIAHSDAVYDEVIKAFENGYTHMTHLYSGMSGVKRVNLFRHAGVIESAFLIDEMTVEIIADGCHLPGSLLKLIYKIKGPSRVALITDSMRGAGMPEGESIIGSLKAGQKVIIEDGVAKLADKTAFAGSVATADRLVRTMVKIAGVPLVDAVKMMTSTPASIMGMDNAKGILTPGKDADIVMFDDNINIAMTMINGEIVYRAK